MVELLHLCNPKSLSATLQRKLQSHMVKVIIADDHPGMREAWQLILSSQDNMQIVAICRDGPEVIDFFRDAKAHLVLMDINMQPMSGLEVTSILLSSYPHLLIIGISIHAEPSYALQMLKRGGKGFITKSSSSDEMLKGIREVIAGNIYICDEVRARMTSD